MTRRRSFVGFVGWLLVGSGTVSGSGVQQATGYGDGGYGDGGFGSGGPALERSLAYYADSDGIVRSSGVSAAFEDWKRDDIETDLLLDVINAWFDGEPVADESG